MNIIEKQVEKQIKRPLQGRVISDKMQKTIVVKIERTTIDPQYGKVIRRTKNYKVHDEQEIAETGDLVEIYEGRPVSKEKFMYLARVLESGKRK